MSTYLQTNKSFQYENCRVLNSQGETMFLCSSRKASWYLDRNLGVKVADNPLTVQLNFTPNGNGHVNDPFYLQEMENRCVVCGCEDNLTRHHVVPICYRRFFPAVFKEHKSHDVIPTCIPCHEQYEKHAWEFKKYIAVQYTAPLDGMGGVFNKTVARVKSAASALLRHHSHMPEARRLELLNIIKNHLQREPSKEDLNELMDSNPYDFKQYTRHGQLVMEQITDTDEFARAWRKHFVDTMLPKFLPKYWEVNRSI